MNRGDNMCIRREALNRWPIVRTGYMLPALLLAGCAVGPNFARPTQPPIAGYTSTESPGLIASSTGEPAQQIQVGKEISAQWWALFRSPALNTVVQDAIRDNKNLAAARATLAAAQESVVAVRGGLFPQVDVAANAGRRKTSGLQLGNFSPTLQGGAPISNLYSLGPTVSYDADVFGGTRRKVEQQQALADSQGYQLAAAYLTLTGNAVTEAITIGSLRAQIQATQEVVASDEQNLSLVQQEFKAGKVARTDFLTAQTQLASDRTSLPPLRQQLSSARHALAILSGRPPAVRPRWDFDIKNFILPGALPLSLPSKLVRQRPDILAAEAQLHADSAAIGIAVAQLYPSITLSASFGWQSFGEGTLFSPANQFWNLSAAVLAPIFEGGTLEAQRRAAIDAYEASMATYEETVLQAFQQVADTLKALAHDVELVDAQRQLFDSASESLELQRISYAAGKTSVLSLIDAQRADQQARLGFVRAQAQRLQDSAQLFVALGGGWWQSKF
jgi:NodT family efflux transporter outer membrane factor (OMF) lipoprotein